MRSICYSMPDASSVLDKNKQKTKHYTKLANFSFWKSSCIPKSFWLSFLRKQNILPFCKVYFRVFPCGSSIIPATILSYMALLWPHSTWFLLNTGLTWTWYNTFSNSHPVTDSNMSFLDQKKKIPKSSMNAQTDSFKRYLLSTTAGPGATTARWPVKKSCWTLFYQNK